MARNSNNVDHVFGIQKHHPNTQKRFKTFLANSPITISGNNMPGFKVLNKKIKLSTQGEIDFIDLSETVDHAVKESCIKNGIAHVFAPHATGILILTENDYALLEDIKIFLEKIVPNRGNYQHPSNAHSHLRSMLLPPDKTLPVVDGQVVFGTWQSLLYVETDVYPRDRTILIQVMGET